MMVLFLVPVRRSGPGTRSASCSSAARSVRPTTRTAWPWRRTRRRWPATRPCRGRAPRASRSYDGPGPRPSGSAGRAPPGDASGVADPADRLPGRDGLAGRHRELGDHAGPRRGDLVLHLHRLDDREHLPAATASPSATSTCSTVPCIGLRDAARRRPRRAAARARARRGAGAPPARPRRPARARVTSNRAAVDLGGVVPRAARRRRRPAPAAAVSGSASWRGQHVLDQPGAGLAARRTRAPP